LAQDEEIDREHEGKHKQQVQTIEHEIYNNNLAAILFLLHEDPSHLCDSQSMQDDKTETYPQDQHKALLVVGHKQGHIYELLT
jgi:hypothetical protein